MHVGGKRQPYEDSMLELCSSGRHRDNSFAVATLKPNEFQLIRHPLAFESLGSGFCALARALRNCSSVGTPAFVLPRTLRPARRTPSTFQTRHQRLGSWDGKLPGTGSKSVSARRPKDLPPFVGALRVHEAPTKSSAFFFQ